MIKVDRIYVQLWDINESILKKDKRIIASVMVLEQVLPKN